MRLHLAQLGLLVALASAAQSAVAREPRRVVMDAREIRIESPLLFASRPATGTLPELAAAPVLPLGLPADRLPRGACERSASDLCFDTADRRIVFRPVRQYMPALDGLTAEGVSLRRDAVRLKYSFR